MRDVAQKNVLIPIGSKVKVELLSVSEELPEESESGPETEAPLTDDPQILLVKRGPAVEEMFIKRERASSSGGKRTRKRKRKRKRTKRKKRRKRKKGTKRRKKRTRRR